MNNIPDRHDEIDVRFYDTPDGLAVIQELPNNIADSLFADFLHEMANSSKSHMQVIFDHALRAEADRQRYIADDNSTIETFATYEGSLRRLLFAVIKCASEAGSSANIQAAAILRKRRSVLLREPVAEIPQNRLT